MNTINKSFNESWKYLAEFHPTAHLPNGESIYFGEKPKKPFSKREWGFYISALIQIAGIGQRNGYIHWHPDRQGKDAIAYVPEDIASGKIKLPRLEEKKKQDHITEERIKIEGESEKYLK